MQARFSFFDRNFGRYYSRSRVDAGVNSLNSWFSFFLGHSRYQKVLPMAPLNVQVPYPFPLNFKISIGVDHDWKYRLYILHDALLALGAYYRFFGIIVGRQKVWFSGIFFHKPKGKLKDLMQVENNDSVLVFSINRERKIGNKKRILNFRDENYENETKKI